MAIFTIGATPRNRLSVSAPPPAPRPLVRRLGLFARFDAVLLLPIADGRFDGVLREHRTVNLHRRQAQFAHDIRVLDRQGLLDSLAFDPLRGKR